MASALGKAEAAGPNGIVNFVVRLDDAVLPASEVAALRQIGMMEYLPFIGQALVAMPARRLLELAELPSVIQVI